MTAIWSYGRTRAGFEVHIRHPLIRRKSYCGRRLPVHLTTPGPYRICSHCRRIAAIYGWTREEG